jgi:hypothetical protein
LEIYLLTAADLADLESGATAIGGYSQYMVASTNDAGTAQVTSGLSAEITAINPSAVSIQFVNVTGQTVFLATDAVTPDNARIPYLRISTVVPAGLYDLSVVDIDTDSLDERGPRVLNVSLPQVQTVEAAQIAARRLLQIASRPRAIITGVELFGDPRRQPGDLVRLVDEDQTGVDGTFRIHGLNNKISAGQYTQTAQMVEAMQVGQWGVSRWGQCLWSAQENPGIYE